MGQQASTRMRAIRANRANRESGAAASSSGRPLAASFRSLPPHLLTLCLHYLDADSTLKLARCSHATLEAACDESAWVDGSLCPIRVVGSHRLHVVRRSRLLRQAPLELRWRCAADDWDHAGSGIDCGERHEHPEGQCCYHQADTDLAPSSSHSAVHLQVDAAAASAAPSSVVNLTASLIASSPVSRRSALALYSSSVQASPSASKRQTLAVSFLVNGQVWAAGDEGEAVFNDTPPSEAGGEPPQVFDESPTDQKADTHTQGNRGQTDVMAAAASSTVEHADAAASSFPLSSGALGVVDDASGAVSSVVHAVPSCRLRVHGLFVDSYMRDMQLEDLPRLLSSPCAQSLTSVRFAQGLRPAAESVEWIAALPLLRRLHLSTPPDPDMLAPLPTAGSLTDLAVGFTLWMREHDVIESLTRCTQLQRLQLRRAMLSGPTLRMLLCGASALARLTTLDLDGCALAPAPAAVAAAAAAASAPGFSDDAGPLSPGNPEAVQQYRAVFESLQHLHTLRLAHLVGVNALLPQLAYAPSLRSLRLECGGLASAAAPSSVLGHTSPTLSALSLLHESTPYLTISLRVSMSPAGPMPPGGAVTEQATKDRYALEWHTLQRGVGALKRVTFIDAP